MKKKSPNISLKQQIIQSFGKTFPRILLENKVGKEIGFLYNLYL